MPRKQNPLTNRKMTNPLEKDLINYLLKGLNVLPNCKAIKLHGSVYMEAGTPDILVSMNGRCVLVEVKRDTCNHPSVIQELRIKEWKWAGADCGIVAGKDEAIRFLELAKTICARPNSYDWEMGSTFLERKL